MASYLLFSFVALQVCVAVVLGEPGDTGDACITTTQTPSCTDATAVCEDDKCMIKSGQTCTNTSECVKNAACADESGTKRCKCSTGWVGITAAGITAGTCGPAPTYIGGTCTGTGKGDCMNAQAECKSGVCACKDGYERTSDNACESGVSSVTASITVLCLALFVSSRFM